MRIRRNSSYSAGYQVAWSGVKSKDRKRDRDGERANLRSRECKLFESKESDVGQGVSRTDSEEMIITIRDTTTGFIYRRGTIG